MDEVIPDVKKPNLIIVLLDIALKKKIMKTTLFSYRTQFDIARGNHA